MREANVYSSVKKISSLISGSRLAKKVSSQSSKTSAGKASANPRAKKSATAKPPASAKSAVVKRAKPRAKKSVAASRLAEALAKEVASVQPEEVVSPVVELDAGEALARSVAEYALSKKAVGVTILDVRSLSDSIDYFVVCSADSDRQVKAISDAIFDGLADEGEKPLHIERKDLTWIVMDYVDVVVHIFVKEKRAFYNLEKLWGDAKFIHIKDDADLAPVKQLQK